MPRIFVSVTVLQSVTCSASHQLEALGLVGNNLGQTYEERHNFFCRTTPLAEFKSTYPSDPQLFCAQAQLFAHSITAFYLHLCLTPSQEYRVPSFSHCHVSYELQLLGSSLPPSCIA